MDELVQWLGEQIDEDERIAKEAGGRRGQWKLATGLDDAELGDASWLRPPYLKHVERHDPARVLAEIDAKRQVLAEFEQADRYSRTAWGQSNANQSRARTLGKVVRLLALPYADRPGYHEEWRP